MKGEKHNSILPRTTMNTQFKLNLRRLYTWRTSAGVEYTIIRNQTDYITVWTSDSEALLKQ